MGSVCLGGGCVWGDLPPEPLQSPSVTAPPWGSGSATALRGSGGGGGRFAGLLRGERVVGGGDGAGSGERLPWWWMRWGELPPEPLQSPSVTAPPWGSGSATALRGSAVGREVCWLVEGRDGTGGGERLHWWWMRWGDLPPEPLQSPSVTAPPWGSGSATALWVVVVGLVPGSKLSLMPPLPPKVHA